MSPKPTREDAEKWAVTKAREIVMREGAALALSARELDEDAISADSTLLAVAIADALLKAFDRELT